MAEKAAEAFLTVAFEKLFKLLASQEFRSFFQGKKSIDDQLGLLNEKLKTASLLLNDAEDRQITDERVKEWLDDLRDVIFRADDLVEDIKAEARSKQESKSSTNALNKMVAFFTPFTEFDKLVQGEIENVLKDLSLLLERASTLCLKHIDRATNIRSLRTSPAPLLEESHVHGRDEDRKEILKLLLSDTIWGNKIGVLPIVGMGGLGKTTLARLVYDDERVKKRGFHHKAWVTVSTEFDIFRITKIILQQVCPQMTSGIEVAELQGQLKEALRGKKFLFILDDVWDENYDNWDSLRSAFMSGDSRSRIIVTTRSQKVASNVKTGEKIHQLQEVSNEDCWKIFVDHAFSGDSVVDPHLQEIGEKIVDKCKGLPLAVRSLGGLLRSERNPEKWESILRNHVWSEKLRNNILPGLWLSYSCLPSSLKQCFAYCSIFPKDHEFEKEKIIWLWIAEGFLQPDQKEKRMEEVGNEYFDELLARSIFQRSNQNESTFVMHDLVHDLAVFVSGEVCLRFDDTTNVEQLTKKTRYFSIEGVGRSMNQKLLKGEFEAKHLRSFLTLEDSLLLEDEFVEAMLKGERRLRVLSQLTATESQTLHDSLYKLKHLRYLDLSCSIFEEIPCSICTLNNLQTLILSNCHKLTKLPKDMGRLIHLRHLVTTKTPLKEMPPQMGNLKELQTLTDFVLGQPGNGSSIKELGALRHLAGKLRISGLQNIDNTSDKREAYLKDKENLTELALEWEGEVTDTMTARDALDALEPHTNLMKLICRFAGSIFPNWLGRSTFSKMESIYLSGNKYCLFLPPLGQLPSLRELKIERFHGVEKIGYEFYNTGNNSSVAPFQSLEILQFSDMKSWQEWSFIDQHGKEGKCFPRLRELCFYRCPNLSGRLPPCDTIETLEISRSYKSMESLPLDNFPKLKKLELHRCENLKELLVKSLDAIEKIHIAECNKLEFPRSHHYVNAKQLTILGGCDSLKSLPLDYFPRLERLCLQSCQNLESLTFTEKRGTAQESLIRSLALRRCRNFSSWPELMHRLLPSLDSLIMSSCPEIKSFPKGGLPSSLNRLEIRDCCKLVTQHKHWDLQKLTSLTSLHVEGNEDTMLDSFPEGLLPSSLTFLFLWHLPHLKSLNDTAFRNVASLSLRINQCHELQFLPEELLQPASLFCGLQISNSRLLERRYHKERGEDWPKISRIRRVHISGETTTRLDQHNGVSLGTFWPPTA